MLHPVTTYRDLARHTDKTGFGLLLRRPLFVAVFVGAFVSFTVSGRLTIPLLLEGTIFWGFVPILQMLLMACIVLAFGRRRLLIPNAVDLFFKGHGPWLLWLLGVAGTCLFFPLRQIYLWPTHGGLLLPISLLVVWLWSNVTTFGFLRGALNLTASRTIAALLLYTAMLWGLLLSYLFAIESLQLHRLRL